MCRNEKRYDMFKKTVYMAVLAAVAALLVCACSGQDTPQKKTDRIDAHTLLSDLEEILKKTPDTEKGCKELLQEIRDWQLKKVIELKNQPKSVKYDFEYQWVPQDYNDSQACTKVLFSEEQAYGGGKNRHSLEMMMNLVSGDKHKSKGEAFVDMRNYPPVGEQIPLDMRGRTISVQIYAPWGAGGTPDKPNGFQVFVKDANENSRSRYGPWYNAKEAEWQEITLRVSRDPPKIEEGEYMDTGFDPSKIAIVGVKMAAGRKGYKGPVFIDAVSW